MLLSFALDRRALQPLREAAMRGGPNRSDFLAAIDAIESGNKNYFVDRDHSGMVTLNLESISVPPENGDSDRDD
jgi:hypothetical protein